MSSTKPLPEHGGKGLGLKTSQKTCLRYIIVNFRRKSEHRFDCLNSTFEQSLFCIPSFVRMKAILTTLILLLSHLVYTQMDSLRLDTMIVIKASHLRQLSQPSHDMIDVSELDDLNAAQDLASLLQYKSNIYIRNNGPGTVSTSSIRGGTSAHTLILWNGIPLRNPMLSLSDLSLFNVNAFDNIQIESGGNSSNWGSGAIGGIIAFNNTAKRKASLSSEISMGSFAYRNMNHKLNLPIGKLISESAYNYTSAHNDFSYAVNGFENKQDNAEVNFHNINQSVYYSASQKTDISLHYWATFAERQIPPLLSQSMSRASQTDESHRLSLNIKSRLPNSILSANLAYIDENMRYLDPQISLDAINEFRNFVADIQLDKNFNGDHKLMLGSTFTHSSALSVNNYEERKQNDATAAFAGLALNWPKKQLIILNRLEVANGSNVYLLPSLQYAQLLGSKILLNIKLSRNYRLPGLNERFWVPGGNPDLSPENGWSQEISVSPNNTGKTFNYNITVFNRMIDNWILWSPSEQQVIWSPRNLNSIWSRGIESMVAYNWNFHTWSISTELKYNYILSTSQDKLEIPRISKGQQIWYTPKSRINFNIGIEHAGFRLNYRHMYSSSVETFNDPIDSYHLSQLNLSFEAERGKQLVKYFFALDNLWDTEYQLIENRPMPGRNFRTGFRLLIN